MHLMNYVSNRIVIVVVGGVTVVVVAAAVTGNLSMVKSLH